MTMFNIALTIVFLAAVGSVLATNKEVEVEVEVEPKSPRDEIGMSDPGVSTKRDHGDTKIQMPDSDFFSMRDDSMRDDSDPDVSTMRDHSDPGFGYVYYNGKKIMKIDPEVSMIYTSGKHDPIDDSDKQDLRHDKDEVHIDQGGPTFHNDFPNFPRRKVYGTLFANDLDEKCVDVRQKHLYDKDKVHIVGQDGPTYRNVLDDDDLYEKCFDVVKVAGTELPRITDKFPRRTGESVPISHPDDLVEYRNVLDDDGLYEKCFDVKVDSTGEFPRRTGESVPISHPDDLVE